MHKRVCIDPSFDQEDRDDIERDLQCWNRAMSGAIDLQVKHGACDWNIQYAVKNDFYGQINDRVLAYANVIGGDTIKVLRWRMHSQDKFRQVVMHEVGHLLGVDHPKDNRGIMAEYYSAQEYKCIDPRSVGEASLFLSTKEVSP